MRKLLLIVAAVATVSGCATVNKQPLATASAKILRGQTVAQTKRPLPDFAAMTAGKAAFAVVGAALMISEGNSLIANNKVSDPADTIAAGLAKALEANHGAKLADVKIAVNTAEVGDVADAAHTAARFVVDVQTINWSFGYFPTDWAHYRVIYTARARLIDTASKSTVAEGFCKRIPESNANAPTYDELTGNGAALLKRELLIAAEDCVKTLESEMLAL